MKQVLKVTAYITREHAGGRQLLVFREEGFEHLGLQVPGGTVETGEALEDAVLREVLEESGLTGLLNLRWLGDHFYSSDKLEADVQRHYYHMEAAAPESFTHVVQSGDEDDGWIYHYSWVDVTKDLSLYGYLGRHLDQLLA